MHSRPGELRTTTMLLCVVGTFLIVELPQGALSLLNYLDDCFYSGVYHKLGDLIDCITLFKNIITFVLLTSMSKQFRDTFIAQLRRLFLLDSRCSADSAHHHQSARVTAVTVKLNAANKRGSKAHDTAFLMHSLDTVDAVLLHTGNATVDNVNVNVNAPAAALL